MTPPSNKASAGRKPNPGAKPRAKKGEGPDARPIRLAFVVNDVATEKNNYTTIRLARVAINRGHEVALVGLDGFMYHASGSVRARASVPRHRTYADDDALLEDLQADDAERKWIDVDQLDVLMLRSDPAEEAEDRPWASNSGLLFAQLAALRHVIVLNDPVHLTDAANKTYFQHFPERVRPVTCITLDADEIRAFIAEHEGYGVIKPLQGSGGQSVFVITPDSEGNLNQMIDAVTRDGYAIVQEYLPEAANGDLRLLMLNGRPLRVEGCYACIRRYNDSGDARSNITAGGKYEMAVPDENALLLAEIVGPKLIRDGMYFAGLDIAGDKMMEINVDTPGGINMVDDLTGIGFSEVIIDDLERKVRLRDQYEGTLTNTELAMM
ncbi:ATP-grasp domain-containing protein [Luteimonas notoginsengisoli]|uniref:ATP-grasp domain-containing protein n=1 Tax=Luteimonas notoginsengisoli TaxID=1578200 RepID=A0ABV7URI4_9GAMM